MPMVVSDKQRIFYRFEGERGAFLLLHHELFGSHADWYRLGFVEELAKEFRLIIVDARGHGRSDRPQEPEAYSLPALAADVIEVMNCLDIRNLHFLGYGLGALVGFELLMRQPDRMRIAMLGGEVPFVTEELRTLWAEHAAALEAGSLQALLDQMRSRKQVLPVAGASAAAGSAADPASSGTVSGTEPEVDEETQHLPALAMLRGMAGWPLFTENRVSVNSPVTLFAGMDDPAAGRVEAARRAVYRARFVPFANLNHVSLLEESGPLLGEVTRLLKTGKRPNERGQDGARGEDRSAGRGDNARGRSGGPAERNDTRRSERRNVPERRAGALARNSGADARQNQRRHESDRRQAEQKAQEASAEAAHGGGVQQAPEAAAPAPSAADPNTAHAHTTGTGSAPSPAAANADATAATASVVPTAPNASPSETVGAAMAPNTPAPQADGPRQAPPPAPSADATQTAPSGTAPDSPQPESPQPESQAPESPQPESQAPESQAGAPSEAPPGDGSETPPATDDVR